MLQLRKCAERKQSRLPLFSLVSMDYLSALQNRHVFSTAGRMRIYIGYFSGQRLADHMINARFGRNSRQIYMLLTRSDHRLHDRISAVCNRFYLDQPAFMACLSIVSRKFRHCITRMCILILDHFHTGLNLSLDNIFRIGNRILPDRYAWSQFNRLPSDCTCNRKLIVSKWRSWRLKARSHLDCRIHSDRNRDRKRLVQFCRPLGHRSDMPASRLQEDGKLVLRLNAHSVYGHIRKSRIGMCRIAHAHRDIRSGIHRCIGRCRNKLKQIKILVRHTVDHLLTWCFFFRHNRLHRV